MPLGMEVGLGPGDIVLDGDSAPSTERGTAAPCFSATLLWHCRPSQQYIGSLMISALKWTCDSMVMSLIPGRRRMGWVTVFGRANHLGISPSHLGQLSLLPYAGRKMGIDQSAVMLCGWGVKMGWLIPYVDKREGGRVPGIKLCDPSLTRADMSALEMSIAQIIKHYTNVLFIVLFLSVFDALPVAQPIPSKHEKESPYTQSEIVSSYQTLAAKLLQRQRGYLAAASFEPQYGARNPGH